MKKSTKWFLIIGGSVFAFFIVMLIIGIVALFKGGEDYEEVTISGKGGTLALIELSEPIVSSENTVRLLKKYRENSSVKGIIFRVETPGGGVAASQEIYEEVKKTRESGKPVVISMGAVAASGGYYISCGASKIVANPGTVTGSIGVITQFMHFNQLMEKIGVSSTTVKSGKLKDSGSPLRAFNEDDKKYFQEVVNDLYAQFVEVVSQERNLPIEKVKQLADGRVYTGKQAYNVGLVDTLGTYEDAITITANLAGISGTPKLIKERKKEKLVDMFVGEAKSGINSLKQEMLYEPLVQYMIVKP